MRKALLILCGILPFIAQAQEMEVPINGTPAIQSPTQQTSESSKAAQTAIPEKVRKAGAHRASPKAVILPPPSQVTRKFYRAIENRNLEIADLMLQQGADINCRNCNGSGTPPIALVQPLIKGLYPNPMLLWFIDRGANLNLQDSSGKTYLMRILGYGVSSVYDSAVPDALYLLSHGADPTIKDNKGATALHYFASTGILRDDSYKSYVQVVNQLIANGAKINDTMTNGYTPLMIVASHCDPDIVKLFLSKGADTTIKGLDGETAMSIALNTATSTANPSCNQVLAVLRSAPSVPDVAQGEAGGVASEFEKGQTVPINGEWQGIFSALTPKVMTTPVTGVISTSGDVIFNAQSGLHGAGNLTARSGIIEGSFTAHSPLDAQGNPVFVNPDGSSDIKFNLSGTVSNGIMRGKYSSPIEEGDFIMCESETYKQNRECRQTASASPVPGILNAIDSLGKLLGTARK